MKRIDEVKYLAEWISWSESEENKEHSEDNEIEVVDVKSLPKPYNPLSDGLKKSIKDLGTNISLHIAPLTDKLALKKLCSEENQKRIKNGYKLIKTITVPIINKKVNVVEYWMDDETKFFTNVTMPLFFIIRDSQHNSKLID
ncbi:MAG: hypothetical protein SNH07_00565 [Rikenellaceae bacterium]